MLDDEEQNDDFGLKPAAPQPAKTKTSKAPLPLAAAVAASSAERSMSTSSSVKNLTVVIPIRIINFGCDIKFEDDPFLVKLHGIIKPDDFINAIQVEFGPELFSLLGLFSLLILSSLYISFFSFPTQSICRRSILHLKHAVRRRLTTSY